MRYLAFAFVLIFFWGCDYFPWEEPGCLEAAEYELSLFARAPNCSEEVEYFIREASEGVLEPHSYWYPMGEYEGVILNVEGRRIEVEFRGEPRTLVWPRSLPFPIEVGDQVRVEVDEGSTTLHFELGALAFHSEVGFAPPPPRGQRVGSHGVRWDEGCVSTYGPTMDLLVGDQRIVPGEAAKIDGWLVMNLGAVAIPMSEYCGMVAEGHFWGRWIAEKHAEVEYCVPEPPIGPACSEEIAAANLEGAAHELTTDHLPAGEYRVVELGDDGFAFADEEEVSRSFSWPGPLPIEIEEGDPLLLEHRGDWKILTLPRGELAFASTFALGFAPPEVSPDEKDFILYVKGCVLDGDFSAPGVRIDGEADKAILFPGQEAKVGAWTYRLLFAEERGPKECYSQWGTMVVEGMGRGTLLAHRSLEPAEDTE